MNHKKIGNCNGICRRIMNHKKIGNCDGICVE
ncbi:hypothetical protein T4A_3004 [Trichinella pseudospiralis]|uniref:Uncharacterized protein n=1 Tax=Trichinella pseudospiralis TaxID=6337 RepID=A0A0V1DS28_TRIPS|nr:hypothetical protein T4A_3004 [Trichinella pseudospiralis]